MPIRSSCGSLWTTRALCLLLLLSCSGGSEPSEPGLVLLSIGPNSVLSIMGGPVVLTVHGTGFQNGAVVQQDSTPLETTFASDTRMSAVLRIPRIGVSDTFTIRVRNSDGELSNGLPFIISSDANPFHFDSTAPANAAEVNADTSLVVYLSDALDTTSIGDTSIVVRDEAGSAVSGTISYDRNARALRWHGALSEVHRYTASLSDELRTPSGGGISGSLTWSFTTTLGVTVRLEEAVTWPSLVLGKNGLPRVVYRTPSKVRVGSCTGSCGTRASWSLSDVGQLSGSNDYLSLAIDGADNLHLATIGLASAATYATPAGQTASIEDGAAYTSIGAGSSGRLHLLYYEDGDLHGAVCSTTCVTSANWQVTPVDTSGNAGSFPSVAVDAQGGVHVTYFENDSGDLRYAVCAAPCTSPSWVAGPVDTVGRVGIGSSLLVDGAGVLHASWVDLDAGDVIYGTCASACTTVDGWSRAVVEHVADPGFFLGFYYTSLALGPNGFELSYYDALGGRLRGASCASNCAATGAWTTFTVSLNSSPNAGFWMTSLKVDSGGKRQVLWVDGNEAVRYTRY
jgi:hypothetical protein